MNRQVPFSHQADVATTSLKRRGHRRGDLGVSAVQGSGVWLTLTKDDGATRPLGQPPQAGQEPPRGRTLAVPVGDGDDRVVHRDGPGHRSPPRLRDARRLGRQDLLPHVGAERLRVGEGNRSRVECDKGTVTHRAAEILLRCFGRSDRRAQGDRSTLRSIRPKRARSRGTGAWSRPELPHPSGRPRSFPPSWIFALSSTAWTRPRRSRPGTSPAGRLASRPVPASG